ncbi:hypothetical protein [Lysinibacillus sp. LZ02]|uniref:hypothetical protein n=1 Tax=Lysinibacillus sp. LZ02 TaxID=3420668 RepID=UPI003D365FF7
MTIHELMQVALACDNVFLATLLYWACQNDKLSLEAPAESLDSLQLSEEEKRQVRFMIKADVLGIRSVKLFAFRIRGTDYALYFATTVQSATQAFWYMYKQTPNTIYDVYDWFKYREFYFESFHAVMSIEQLKHEVTAFPYFVGVVEGKW